MCASACRASVVVTTSASRRRSGAGMANSSITSGRSPCVAQVRSSPVMVGPMPRCAGASPSGALDSASSFCAAATAIMSPLAEKPRPTACDMGRPGPLERSSSSVEPSVPAATTTRRARTT
ncbi:hypothetical protein FQZ97_633420 [compost metagenome]